ncbi:MAG: hypothetical protein PVJ39_04650 [Gammaproteobacteria bacterium]|jgi:hypothetical protein
MTDKNRIAALEQENRELRGMLGESQDIIKSLTSGMLKPLGVSEITKWGRDLIERINAKIQPQNVSTTEEEPDNIPECEIEAPGSELVRCLYPDCGAGDMTEEEFYEHWENEHAIDEPEPIFSAMGMDEPEFPSVEKEEQDRCPECRWGPYSVGNAAKEPCSNEWHDKPKGDEVEG